MKIQEVNRTQADIILAIIKNRISADNDAQFELDVYNNGRERGYVLTLTYVDNQLVLVPEFNTWIAFSEFRRSDDTVVYTDTGYWNGKITEKSYNECKMFKYGEFIETADYIIELMQDAVNKVKESRSGGINE